MSARPHGRVGTLITLSPIGADEGIEYVLGTAAASDERVWQLGLTERYAHAQDTPGLWVGRAARWLGLEGAVSYAHATALFRDGAGPDGERLGARWIRTRTVEQYYQELLDDEPGASSARREILRIRAERAGHREARTGWELVFAPSKSFSVLWALGDDAARAALEYIENEAFRTILERIENEASWIRTGSGTQEQGDGLAGAVFTHRSSRSGDPLYHRHLMISAKVPYGIQWLSLDARPLHRLMVALTEHYHAEIEIGMARHLGIYAQPVERGAHLGRPTREFAGVDNQLIKEFSTRRGQIEKETAERSRGVAQREGREPSADRLRRIAQYATLATRPTKTVRDPEDERDAWKARADALGLARDGVLATAMAASARIEPTPDVPLADIPILALHRLELERGIFTRTHVQAEVTRQLTAHRWHLALGDRLQDRIERLTDAVLAPQHAVSLEAPEPIDVPRAYLREDQSPVFDQVLTARHTTHRILAAESAVLAHAGERLPAEHLDPRRIAQTLTANSAERGFTPSAEQSAVAKALFDQPRRISAVIGRAGTGKTALMRLIGEIARAEGLPVLGLSRSQLQAANLAVAAGIRTENTAKWLYHSRRSRNSNWRLPARCIVIVDEAAQTSTLDIASLLEQVLQADGRLILTGDPRQLGAIGPGGVLTHLEEAGQALSITENRRFRQADGTERIWETTASTAVADGDDESSFTAYHVRGRIHAGTGNALADSAVAAYLDDLDDGLVSILIAPDNDAAADVSARARNTLIKRGRIQPHQGSTTAADGNAVSFGDIIETRRNDPGNSPARRRPVANGDLWRIIAVHPDGSVSVERIADRARTNLDVHYLRSHAGLGYAVTKDRAQGLTVDIAHTLVNATYTRNALYPAITRGRLANHIYLDADQEPYQDTARHAWKQIVGRTAKQLTATLVSQTERETIATLAALTRRLRYTVEDLFDERVRAANFRLGLILPSFPAWPTLRESLLTLEASGFDPAKVMASTADERELASADDPAAVLQWRLLRHREYRHVLRADHSDLTDDGLDIPPQHAAPAADLLAELGLSGPALQPADPDKLRYAHELQDAVRRRATAVTEHALAMARSGEGWPCAYGPEPEKTDTLGIARHLWTWRIQAAARYRDLAGYRDQVDPVGPAPQDVHLRRLWRHAQPPADAVVQQAAAFTAASSGALWADVLGSAPASTDPHFAVWAGAASAIVTYRSLWSYEREDDPIGQRPTEPVQATDWDIAAHAMAALQRRTPPRRTAALDGPELARAAAGLESVRSQLAEAAAAEDRLREAGITLLAASQAAEDAIARANTARRSGHPRAHVLHRQAVHACLEADQAAAERTALANAHRHRPTEISLKRTELRDAQVALAEYERRVTAKETQSGWLQRPHGRLATPHLEAAIAAAASSVSAIQAELAQRVDPPKTFPGFRAHADREAEQRGFELELDRLSLHLSELKAEQRARRAMNPARRAAENLARAETAGSTPPNATPSHGTAAGVAAGRARSKASL